MILLGVVVLLYTDWKNEARKAQRRTSFHVSHDGETPIRLSI
jgi:hypothetical protein